MRAGNLDEPPRDTNVKAGRRSSRLDLSVIVCTYNREEPLRNLLSDLLTQESTPHEILVADQTPDHELKTVELLGDSRLTVIGLEEANLPAARNAALKQVTGNIVLFVDDDIRLMTSFTRVLLDLFSDVLVEGLAPVVVFDGMARGSHVERRHRSKDIRQFHGLHRVDSVIGACMAFRRDALMRSGPFDPLFGRVHPSAAGEDHEFTRRFTRAGFRLYLSSSLHVRHEWDRPGGCEARTGDSQEQREVQRRAMVYIILKEQDALFRFNLRAALRLLDSELCRRDVTFSPVRLLSTSVLMVRAVRSVRRSWRDEQMSMK